MHYGKNTAQYCCCLTKADEPYVHPTDHNNLSTETVQNVIAKEWARRNMDPKWNSKEHSNHDIECKRLYKYIAITRIQSIATDIVNVSLELLISG